MDEQPWSFVAHPVQVLGYSDGTSLGIFAARDTNSHHGIMFNQVRDFWRDGHKWICFRDLVFRKKR
ncbi:hypothetical protein [Acidithiobacillus marinus]|uniref:hypothetical protein n=1 Tax=Acidithiobacillus marinus TaxID=187490 RepID=UPI00209C69F3|nr:hypothetical protein [Acidithiobacillus marinus]